MTGLLAAQLAGRLTGAWTDIQAHLPYLRDTIAGLDPPVTAAELGVRGGNSTCALLAGLEQHGTGTLWSVDVATPQVPAAWRALPCWKFLRCGDLAPAALAWIPAQLDLLFIDTSHGYTHTLAELRAYGPRVRPGGYILCHDTQWAYGDQDLGAPCGPVAGALNSWCSETGQAWENRPGSYGLGVLRR